jgi:hypothetical protein
VVEPGVRSIDAIQFQPDSGKLTEADVDNLPDPNDTQVVLEDLALATYLRTQDIDLVIAFLGGIRKVSRSSAYRLIQNARERQRQEILTVESAQIVADSIAFHRMVRTLAMDKVMATGEGTFQQNAFLQTAMQAQDRIDRLLTQVGRIPTMPAQVDINLQKTQETKLTVLHLIEKLPVEQQEQVRKKLYAAIESVGGADRVPVPVPFRKSP